MKKKLFGSPELCGTAVLGERGQVVVPKEARKLLKLKTGDTFLVMVHNEALVLLPKDRMKAFIKKLADTLSL